MRTAAYLVALVLALDACGKTALRRFDTPDSARLDFTRPDFAGQCWSSTVGCRDLAGDGPGSAGDGQEGPLDGGVGLD